MLPAAATILAGKGFDLARRDSFGQRSGLRRSTLYWYFGRDDDAILSIVNQDGSQEMGTLEEVLALNGKAANWIETLIQVDSSDIKEFSKKVASSLDFHASAVRK